MVDSKIGKMSRFFLAILAIVFAVAVSAKKGYGPGEQDWGHVEVRKGAHMFYWLYYTTARVRDYTERPLTIWLQGGPGASSTGYGNFEELGPLDLYGNYRNHTWVKDMNVLFIDNPVGSGFSYVDKVSLLTTTNNQIALDLVEFMKGFYKLHPEFENCPLHIFCESYGGKMAPEFAWELYNAIKRGELRSNFKSVNLGDAWTSPIESVLSWAPFLLENGIVDELGYENIREAAEETERLVNEGKWVQATAAWTSTQRVVLRESKGVDFYNIQTPTRGDAYASRSLLRSDYDLMYRTLVKYDINEDRGQMLDDLMKGPVSKALNITNVKWGSLSSATFSRLSGDFMKPVVDIVIKLLEETDLLVSVYTGNLDLICSTPGTVHWIAKMVWSYKWDYIEAPRVAINANGILEGYEKNALNFHMFWINRAGHMVPADNPIAMDYILRKITKYNETVKYDFL